MEKIDGPQLFAHSEQSLNYTIYDAKWLPCTAKFICLGSTPQNKGMLQIYQLEKDGIKKISESLKSNSFKCGTFGASLPGTRHLATGNFDGGLSIFDIEKDLMPTYISSKAHDEIINCIDGVGGLEMGVGAAEIVTGSRDGKVRVWDARQKDYPVAQIEPDENEDKRDCWSVAFGNSWNSQDRCVAAGYDNGDFKLIDLRNMSIRYETNFGNGICGIDFDRKDINMNKIVVTGLESTFHVIDVRTQHPTKGFASLKEKEHKSTIWSAKHLPQSREIFVTCGGNGTAALWKYWYPKNRVGKDSDDRDYGIVGTVEQIQKTILSTQPISNWDWHQHKIGLAVATSFDQCVRVIIATKLNNV
ncbi:hypothetical protein SNEBB_001205 [Seison nebaliae]|nr:hypothetical protein SNEBB_001205 [Seison nebaliae]